MSSISFSHSALSSLSTTSKSCKKTLIRVSHVAAQKISPMGRHNKALSSFMLHLLIQGAVNFHSLRKLRSNDKKKVYWAGRLAL